MATSLFERSMAFDYGDAKRSALMRTVWSDTPWMVDAYTGGYSRDRDREDQILRWCYAEFGEMASPIHGRAGRWHRGSATINGWTWMGFATEAEMNRFVNHWPIPEGVIDPGNAG